MLHYQLDSEFTKLSAFQMRRQLLKAACAIAASAAMPVTSVAFSSDSQGTEGYDAHEPLTDEYNATHYNNFYELGTFKHLPAERGHRLVTDNWRISVTGEARTTGTFALHDLIKDLPLVHRIYRLRCVEAWSMVIPWIGFELRHLLKRLAPTEKSRFVVFESIFDPENLPGQKRSGLGTLSWPYREGLRLDEAMHPLTIMAVGMYGKPLPPQNGAPIRLVVPWKYGFKSIKSIVRIHFQQTQPETSWSKALPDEYGFYANVNPDVDHPRWSQKWERRILNRGFNGVRRVRTELFNGYGRWVADMYRGMDLRTYF